MEKEIQKIETRIKQIQEKLNEKKQQINAYENNLLDLTQQLENYKKIHQGIINNNE